MSLLRSSAVSLVALCALPLAVHAATPLPTPAVRVVEYGFAKVTLEIQAGAYGAPAGFTVMWMKRTDFLANGQQWYNGPNGIQQVAAFTGVPTLNTWGGQFDSFVLVPGETSRIEIGDLFDETGVAASSVEELEADRSWVFGVFLNGNATYGRSPTAPPAHAATRGDQNCTYTIGYWKNHPDLWPVAMLTLGTKTYEKSQLVTILKTPVTGNGLVSLTHQLIATKLNIANGATPTDVSSAIAMADWMINSMWVPPYGSGYLHPSQTSVTTQILDDFNNGIIGPGHCPTAVKAGTWGGTKAMYR